MSFTINMHARAMAELDAIHDSLSAYSETAADRTYALIKDGILGLSDFPRRYAIAPESERSSIEVRHLIIGNYRVLYSIIGATVSVWRVVHGARRAIDPIDLY